MRRSHSRQRVGQNAMRMAPASKPENDITTSRRDGTPRSSQNSVGTPTPINMATNFAANRRFSRSIQNRIGVDHRASGNCDGNWIGLTLVLTGAGPGRKVANGTNADLPATVSRKHGWPCVRVQHVVRPGWWQTRHINHPTLLGAAEVRCLTIASRSHRPIREQ